MAIQTVLIVGAGVMGSGIGQTLAANGINVILADQTEALVEKAKASVAAGIETMENAALYTPEQIANAKSLITYITSAQIPDYAAKADLALESASERHEVKISVFAQLDQYCRKDCLLCSNTSASNIFEYIQVSDPSRLLILHWFNPAYLMRLVEVVMGPETSEQSAAKAAELARAIGKKPCVLKRYIPGFVVNRLANAICREAGYMITNGWVSGSDIDAALSETSGIRYAFEGPLALNDFLGWDLILTGCHDVYASLCNDSDTSALAEYLVREGKLGLKSGQGIYDYTGVDPEEFRKQRNEKIIKMSKMAQSL